MMNINIKKCNAINNEAFQIQRNCGLKWNYKYKSNWGSPIPVGMINGLEWIYMACLGFTLGHVSWMVDAFMWNTARWLSRLSLSDTQQCSVTLHQITALTKPFPNNLSLHTSSYTATFPFSYWFSRQLMDNVCTSTIEKETPRLCCSFKIQVIPLLGVNLHPPIVFKSKGRW